MITIQRETVDQCITDIQPLLRAHWEEIGLYRESVALAPDYEKYRSIEKLGRLVIVTARIDGSLVGYAVFSLQSMIHYKDCISSLNDVIFVSREYRKGTSIGLRLIKESEALLASLGARRILWHMKPSNDWSGILRRMGYQQEEIVMGKLLG